MTYHTWNMCLNIYGDVEIVGINYQNPLAVSPNYGTLSTINHNHHFDRHV